MYNMNETRSLIDIRILYNLPFLQAFHIIIIIGGGVFPTIGVLF